MHRSLIFRLFPPPKLMTFDHVGLDISDDGIRALRFGELTNGPSINQSLSIDFPPKIIEGGEILDPVSFERYLTEVQKKINAKYVKVSIPEEKSYLFMTDVPNLDSRSIYLNIESKLEENIPLPAAEVVFYYELLPHESNDNELKASVSVVPKSYVEQLSVIIEKTGMNILTFEIAPRSIARSSIVYGDKRSVMIIHAMNNKIGFYITYGGIVCFSSTLTCSQNAYTGDINNEKIALVKKEANRIYSYWLSHGIGNRNIAEIQVAGKGAQELCDMLQGVIDGTVVEVSTSNVWKNVLNLDKYTPDISKADSYEFAVASGLALVL